MITERVSLLLEKAKIEKTIYKMDGFFTLIFKRNPTDKWGEKFNKNEQKTIKKIHCTNSIIRSGYLRTFFYLPNTNKSHDSRCQCTRY